MNKACENYWHHYWQGSNQDASVCAWQFGGDSDKLANLVVQGIKTATCSAYVFYELEHEEIPKVGEYNIILNSRDEPVCITKTVDVRIMPMNEVSKIHAKAEGEGDRTFQYWWRVHHDYFTKELATIEESFKEDMLLVCERFTLVDVRG